MNLSVATKIIGGFSIISILLIITSVSSLLNFNTIQGVSEFTIPTLTSSNELAIELSEIGTLTVKAYYQHDLKLLAQSRDSFTLANTSFAASLEKLESLVQKQPDLTGKLTPVGDVYKTLVGQINDIFNNRKASVEQKNALFSITENLEDNLDEAANLLLDLADHDLAATTLKRSVEQAERIESLFNVVINSTFEHRDALDKQLASEAAEDMQTVFSDIQAAFNQLSLDLVLNGEQETAAELKLIYAEISKLLTSKINIFTIKTAQLHALSQASKQLVTAEQTLLTAKRILASQFTLANAAIESANVMVKQAVSSGNNQAIVIMIVSIITSIVIARLTLLSITRPLARVNKMLKIVSNGDLSHKLDQNGTDEFSLLSKNCNTLIDSLRGLIQSIVSSSCQLASAAEETSTVTTISTKAIQDQRSQVEKAATATTAMSSTSKTVLSSAKEALVEIKNADEQAERVKEISVQNRATIELLANKVETASSVINQLQQNSASIGGILDVIRGLAEQTNLLALNAAIEAARAGEHGRGFAVVADEVRRLANNTQNSAQEINVMIEVLQTGAEEAVNVMEIGKNQAANCVAQSQQADKALTTITHAVHEAYDRSTQIANVAQEQSAVVNEISDNLESIVISAEQTSSASLQTAESSSEVAHLAEDLQESVQAFTL
jgi:methyl-accepting chemotaxis protein